MNNTQYESGKIKVVWIEQEPNEIFSKMFDTEEEAEAFGKKKKDYIIFALERQKDMEEFSWRLLPYGRYKIYLSLVKSINLGSILS